MDLFPRAIYLLAAFAIPVLGAVCVIHFFEPVGFSEDHILIGRELYATGHLTILGMPSLFRPPGSPAFIAAALWVADLAGAPHPTLADDIRIVVLAQCVLLGCFSAAIFLTAATWCPLPVALATAFIGALNPYLIAITTVVAYHLLFLTMVAISTYLTVLAERNGNSWLLWLAAGLLWGLTALVKPVALLLPVFLGLWALLFYRFRRAVLITSVFAAGMCIAIAPYVARNYAITGKPLLTSQGGIVLWSSTVVKVPPTRPFLDFGEVWLAHGQAIFRRVVGPAPDTELPFVLLMQHTVAVNEAFAAEAWQNLKREPGVYLYNVVHNLINFVRDDMSAWSNSFLILNKALDLKPTVDFLMRGITLFGVLGFVLGILARPRLTALLLVPCASAVVAHAISFAYELYTYVMLPTIVLGLAMAAERLWHFHRHRSQRE